MTSLADIAPQLTELKALRERLKESGRFAAKEYHDFRSLNHSNLEERGLVERNTRFYTVKEIPYCGHCQLGLVYHKEAQEPQQIFKKSTGPNFQHPDQEMILLLMENRMFGVLANYMKFFNYNNQPSQVTIQNPAIRMRPQDIK